MHGMQSVWLLLWIVTLFLLSSKCNSVTYYVTPNTTTPCPSEPCHVLRYYAQHNTFNTSNARFVFLPGNHTLNTTIVVQNVQNLTLTGDDGFETGLLGLPAPSSQIHCKGINGTGFDFENSFNLNIESLLFSKCAHDYSHKCPDSLLEMIVALTVHNAFNSTISMVTIQQSPGCGIVAVNMFGSIADSIFLVSNGTLAHFMYCYHEKHKERSTTFVMNSSRFLYGYNNGAGGGAEAGGLSFEVEKSCHNITITINNITAIGNAAFYMYGGQMSIQWNTRANSSILVTNSYFVDGHADSPAGSGGGVNVYILIQHTTAHSFTKHHLLEFVNCTYQSNSARYNGGAATIWFERANFDEPPQAIYLVSFSNCEFMNNTSLHGVAQALEIYSLDPPILSLPYCKVTFNNCTFAMSPPVDTMSATSSVISLAYPQNITFSNCTFEDNFGAAIVAVNSIITLDGNITFRNNSGTDGGALVFDSNSYMFLQNNTHIYFIDNHAEHVGGAIYVQDCLSVCPCFFQVPIPISLNIVLSFGNNTAEAGGTALYGGLLGECTVIEVQWDVKVSTVWKLFEIISDLHNTVMEPSSISSDPIGVCFCINNTLHCRKKWNSIIVYPGQSFDISAVTVGQRNGTVLGAIHADIDNGTIDKLQTLQSVQSYKNCTNLIYTVFTIAKSATMTLTVSSPQSSSSLLNFDPPPPPKVHIILQDCPAGFTLEKYTTQPKCDCVPILKKHHVTCDINKGTIHRPASSWIGYYNASHDNETSGVLYYPYCPLDYCRHTDMDIQLNNPDEQCAFSHAGILCGSCKPGLSLALGTSQCLKCSNAYLTLVVAFGVAGLALVFLLVLCNLTVTEGTLNGLIFYANIVWVNKAIFFPSNNTNILTVFIAWINLDLGIQTCFYDGMGAYGKTWLQIAFPLYIWTIVGLIIYLSRYRAVNRLIGQNAVKVLATLFLLSYAKLQRTIIATLSFTFIRYPDNSKRYVWLYDGNVNYFTGKEIPLFMAGLASLLFMSLPYTLALLLICYVRRIATPRYRLLRWIVRLLPLFDAYTAPYKPRYQFWTGFLLLVRNILFLVFAINYSNDPAWNLMAIAIASLFVFTLTWNFRAVYKQWPLDVLESSFILNLGSVSVIVLYTGVSQSASVMAYTSTGIAFTTFVGIIIFHCSKQLSKTELWRGFRAAARSQLGVGRRGREDEAEPLLPETGSPDPREREMPHLVYYDPRHYRESMLEQLSDSRRED